MKLMAEYLEHAIQFERLAEGETDSQVRDQFLDQAKAYRTLAEKRADQLGLRQANRPENSQ
jgi:hypothetical protein